MTLTVEPALELRLSWLAGIIDGEGSVCIAKGKGHFLTGNVSIGTTSIEMMCEIISILESIGVSHYSLEPRSNVGWGRKLLLDLKISKQESLCLLLDTIIPFLINKRKQAKILLEFIKLRLSKRGNRSKISSYSNEERILREHIMELNK